MAAAGGSSGRAGDARRARLYARELLADQAGGVGYLLKDRVFTDQQFTDALRTVAHGGTVMDPEVVAKLLAKRTRQQAAPGSPTGNAKYSR